MMYAFVCFALIKLSLWRFSEFAQKIGMLAGEGFTWRIGPWREVKTDSCLGTRGEGIEQCGRTLGWLEPGHGGKAPGRSGVSCTPACLSGKLGIDLRTLPYPKFGWSPLALPEETVSLDVQAGNSLLEFLRQ